MSPDGHVQPALCFFFFPLRPLLFCCMSNFGVREAVFPQRSHVYCISASYVELLMDDVPVRVCVCVLVWV